MVPNMCKLISLLVTQYLAEEVRRNCYLLLSSLTAEWVSHSSHAHISAKAGINSGFLKSIYHF